MATKNPQKIPKNFQCNLCDYNTSNKKDYNKHLSTLKHKNQQKSTKIPKNPQTINYVCDNCDKQYRDRSGLWRHKKNCIIENKIENEIGENNITTLSNLITEIIKDNNNEVIKDNQELKQFIIDLCKNNINNINNNIITNNTNCNNKTFNLQVFLNETCKDAMNIMEFVDSISLQLSDLENIGKLGYIEGISNIIVNNLKLLDITQRPIHCSDMKREVFYIKDEDKWEKENDENTKIKKIIKCVANKNIKLIPKWKQENPDCVLSSSNKSDKINKIIFEAMGGSHETKDAENKIIKNIAKQVTINKN